MEARKHKENTRGERRNRRRRKEEDLPDHPIGGKDRVVNGGAVGHVPVPPCTADFHGEEEPGKPFKWSR